MRPGEFEHDVDADELQDANDVAHYPQASRSWVYRKAEASLLLYLLIGALPTENVP